MDPKINYRNKYKKYKKKYQTMRMQNNGSIDIYLLIKDIKRNPNKYNHMLNKFNIPIDINKLKEFTEHNFISNFCPIIPKQIAEHTDATNNQRVRNRINDINMLMPNRIKNSFKYLDIGCGDGVLTNGVKDYFKLSPDNVYGIDIQQWSGKTNSCNTKHMDYINEQTLELPYTDNFFDFITSFQVLHHVKNVHKLINEIKRVLKPNGFLLIREHDLTNITKELIDFEHLIYLCVEEKEIRFDKYYSNYRTKKEWHDMINLKILKCNDARGPTNYYSCVYTK